MAERSPEMLDQLTNALYVISRPALRRAFLTDPHSTLERHGAKDLPRELVDVLANMTYEELAIVARLYVDGGERGVVIGTRAGGINGSVL